MRELFSNLRFAWKYAKDQKSKLILFILCNIVTIFISALIPVFSAKIIVDLTNNEFMQVLYISIVILLVRLVENVMHFYSRYFSQVIYRESFTKIQTSLGEEILKLENECIDKHSSGVFIQRLTSDSSKIADIFNVLNMYLSNIITNIGIFIAVFVINKIAFFYLVFMILLIYLVENVRVKIYNEQDKVYRKKHEKVAGFVGELVRGIRDIKMLNAENSFMRELHSKVIDLNNQRYCMGKTDRNYSLLRDAFMDLFDIGMIFLLVYLIIKKDLDLANALVIHNYMGGISSVVYYFSLLITSVKDFNLSSSRIFSIIDSNEFKKEKFGTKHIDKVEGNFEFKNVVFGYKENEMILKDVSFAVKKDETVAFVGKSGSGKSTIFSLLCKMYDNYEGVITIDDIDIKELDKDTIRGNITIISQNPYIFNLSIKDNLRLVKEDVTFEEIQDACKLACLDEFIESLPDKYDTLIGEGGVNLSGGQKQRLGIARALVQKTEIILFDEATSALDNETQSRIQEAIDNMKRDYTILIIAHRLSTVINSDRILFLNDGKIEDAGTHKELLKRNKEYKKLYEAELKKDKES